MIHILGILLFSASIFAFNKDFKTINDRVPLEFQQLFTSMKLEVKTPIEKVQLIGVCKELDDNLAFLPKEHLFLFLKSEVIKNTLEYKFSKVRQFDLTASLISKLESDLTRKEQYLNPFSLWIHRSIIAELKARQDSGLIGNRSFTPQIFEGQKKADALRFERYLKYLMPWIDRMDGLTPVEFNQLSKEVGWTIFRRINDRSLLFKKFSSTAAGDTRIPLFNIPQKLLEINPEEIRNIQSEKLLPASLRDQGSEAKSQALEAVESATPTDMSPLSEEIDKIDGQ